MRPHPRRFYRQAGDRRNTSAEFFDPKPTQLQMACSMFALRPASTWSNRDADRAFDEINRGRNLALLHGNPASCRECRSAGYLRVANVDFKPDMGIVLARSPRASLNVLGFPTRSLSSVEVPCRLT